MAYGTLNHLGTSENVAQNGKVQGTREIKGLGQRGK